MSNLTKKHLIQSTIFQYGMLVDAMVGLLYLKDILVTGEQLIATITAGFLAYVAKEGVAKGAEAYRDKE